MSLSSIMNQYYEIYQKNVVQTLQTFTICFLLSYIFLLLLYHFLLFHLPFLFLFCVCVFFSLFLPFICFHNSFNLTSTKIIFYFLFSFKRSKKNQIIAYPGVVLFLLFLYSSVLTRWFHYVNDVC